MSIKQGRMSDRIHQILSTLLLREVADPRLQNVSITEVELDPELMYAKVYVVALGEEKSQEEVMKAFRRASGFLRREVGKRIRLRHTPELHFHWDHTLDNADRIHRILSNLDIPESLADESSGEE